jgi:hypothetical protein
VKTAQHLERSLPHDLPFTTHWSGCPAGCGNHALADIGLLGGKRYHFRSMNPRRIGPTLFVKPWYPGASTTGLLLSRKTSGRVWLGAGRRCLRLSRSALLVRVLLALKSGEMAADAIVGGLAKEDTSAAQFGKWGPLFNQGVDRMPYRRYRVFLALPSEIWLSSSQK